MERLDQTPVEITHKVLTVPNVISVSRIVAAALLVWAHATAGLSLPVHLMVVWIIVSDYLDGRLARGTGTVSELGKFLDPTADKIAAALLFGYTGVAGLIPWWFVTFGLTRDLLIGIGGALVKAKNGKSLMAVWSGKIGVNVLAVYWLIAVYLPNELWLQVFLQGAATMMLLYAFHEYAVRAWKAWHGAEYN